MLDIVRHDLLGVAKLSLRGVLVFGPDTAALLAAVNDVLQASGLSVVCDLGRALEWRHVPRPPGATQAATVRMEQGHRDEDDE
jgi:hypothetical protein